MIDRLTSLPPTARTRTAFWHLPLRALLVVCGLLVLHPLAAAESRNVLVLYSNNRLVPANVAIDRGLRTAIRSTDDRPVQVFSEFFDWPDFGGEAYERTMTAYVREKYAARPPVALVAVGDNALDFLLRNRGNAFPGVPLVHMAAARSHLRELPNLPADVVGVPLEYDFSGTIQQALRWHPRASRLLIVTGTAPRDREWEARLRREVAELKVAAAVEFLAGIPTAVLLKRLGELGDDAVVFTPGFFRDGDGRSFVPRDAAVAIAGAATAPVYGPFDTFIGTGVVGGRMPNFEFMGRQAAESVNAVLDGGVPPTVKLPHITPNYLNLDWRQARRWGIREADVPPDTIVHFREPTFWEAYRTAAVITAAVILLQAALIAALLLERRRRRSAEVAVQEQRSELAHASRLAVAGELTASIAHEINQPLGAILTNADAAEMLLAAGGDRRDELREILTDIRRDDLRASQVIRRLRSLLAKHEVERQTFDLNETVNDVATLLGAEARRRQVSLEVRPAADRADVVGDAVQIQQVLINLVLNALDAVTDAPHDRRAVAVSVEKQRHRIAVAVRDRGHGIAPEHLPRLFDSFFSTKQRGMGLGLSIARTIVEAHGGRIWAESGTGAETVFHVELPEPDMTDVPLAAHA